MDQNSEGRLVAVVLALIAVALLRLVAPDGQAVVLLALLLLALPASEPLDPLHKPLHRQLAQVEEPVVALVPRPTPPA